VTGNGISKLVFTILSAVAEAERDRIRERIRDVKADQRKRLRYLGGIVPFGWRIGEDGALIEVPEQQCAIQRIIELRRNGLSLRAISAAIAADGLKLSHEGVNNVLAAAENVVEGSSQCQPFLPITDGEAASWALCGAVAAGGLSFFTL
jgi:putative DNA-invertase from lambdoid prophage Rac